MKSIIGREFDLIIHSESILSNRFPFGIDAIIEGWIATLFRIEEQTDGRAVTDRENVRATHVLSVSTIQAVCSRFKLSSWCWDNGTSEMMDHSRVSIQLVCGGT